MGPEYFFSLFLKPYFFNFFLAYQEPKNFLDKNPAPPPPDNQMVSPLFPYAIWEQQRRRSACASALISTFVVRCLDSMISLVSILAIS